MEAMNAVEARRNFSELINRVAYSGSRVVVERRGRPLAALISAEDLAQLQAWEREHDAARARQEAALAKARAVRMAILAERGGTLLPEPAQSIRSAREERGDELGDLRCRQLHVVAHAQPLTHGLFTRGTV